MLWALPPVKLVLDASITSNSLHCFLVCLLPHSSAMATTDRRQTLADHIGPSKSRLNEAKTARRRITNDSGRTHGRGHDHDFDVNTDPFTTGRRSTHVYNPNLSRTPAPRYPQSTTRQQRVSIREENHDNPFQGAPLRPI